VREVRVRWIRRRLRGSVGVLTRSGSCDDRFHRWSADRGRGRIVRDVEIQSCRRCWTRRRTRSSSCSGVVLEGIRTSRGDIRDGRSSCCSLQVRWEGVSSKFVARDDARAHPRRREVLELKSTLKVRRFGERSEFLGC